MCHFKTSGLATCGLSFRYERELRAHKHEVSHGSGRAAAAVARRKGAEAQRQAILVQEAKRVAGGDEKREKSDESEGEEEAMLSKRLQTPQTLMK